jgi:hypothetical protein
MLNISIDTCIWLELLKVDFNNEDNYLEELCFWVENKHLKHIAPVNILDEWNRNKLNYQRDITAHFNKIKADQINFFKNNTELSSTYQPDTIEANVQKRIERIDLILNTHSEKASHDEAILKEAGDRNLKTLAPNHKKDSFRDTVNILSLLAHLKSKSYTNSIFTTLNYKDFAADRSKRYELHNNLKADFASVDLTYIYFDEKENFGTRLFNELRKETSLPNYQDYLKNKKDKETAKALSERKEITIPTIDNPDEDFLENIKYIDAILSKAEPTAMEKEMLKFITRRHDSYKQYFLRNVGSHGMV